MAIVRWSLVGSMAIAAAGAWFSCDRLAHAHREERGPVPLPDAPGHPAGTRWRVPDLRDRISPSGRASNLDLDRDPTSTSTDSIWPRRRSTARNATATVSTGARMTRSRDDDPEARCDKCEGMKLLPREPVVARPGGGVPGLAAVESAPLAHSSWACARRRVLRGHLAPRLRTVGFVSADEKAARHRLHPLHRAGSGSCQVARAVQRVQKGQVPRMVYSPDSSLPAECPERDALGGQQGPRRPAPARSRWSNDARKRLELLGISREDVVELAQRGQASTLVPLRSTVPATSAKKERPARPLSPARDRSSSKSLDLSSVFG